MLAAIAAQAVNFEIPEICAEFCGIDLLAEIGGQVAKMRLLDGAAGFADHKLRTGMAMIDIAQNIGIAAFYAVYKTVLAQEFQCPVGCRGFRLGRLFGQLLQHLIGRQRLFAVGDNLKNGPARLCIAQVFFRAIFVEGLECFILFRFCHAPFSHGLRNKVYRDNVRFAALFLKQLQELAVTFLLKVVFVNEL